jgi:hypothetical protein
VIVQDSPLAHATARDPQRRQKDEPDASSLFDVIFASQQIAQQLAPPELNDGRDHSWGRTEARIVAAAPIAPAPVSSETPPVQSSTHEISPTDSRSEVTRTARHSDTPPPPVNPSQHADAMILQGTLPVIVAGQLVELTVLRERRAQHDALATRRLTMTLQPTSAAEVRIDAHVDGDRLIVQFAGPGAADVTSCARHADEVRSLAQRLGWTFAEMTWGAAE